MTLTFDIESWVLYVTRLLIIINILTKLYKNTTITFLRDTPTQHGEHFHKVSWRYNRNLWSCGPDKAHITHFWPLTSKCDLDLWHRVMGLVCDTPSHHYKHFDQVIWKCNNNFWSYSSDGRTDGRIRTLKLQIVATMSRSPQAGSTKIEFLTNRC